MRKWMRDRLERRKKKPAEQGSEPAVPPLQPAYFDADQAPTPVAESTDHEAEEPVRGEPDSNAQSGHEDSREETVEPVRPSPVPTGDGPRSRGRRRRGGRGRGGKGREQAVAQAFTPAAAKGTVPEVGADPQAEEGPLEAGSSEGASPEESPVPNLSAESAPAIGELPAARRASPAPPARAAVPVAPPRPPKGIVVLAIGLPGSGKSSWFKRHNVVPLSTDMVRSLLFDDVREQRFQDLVFSNLRSMLKARLIAKRPMNYVDATNLTPQERQHWIKLAKDYEYEVHAIFFDVPLEVCVERHQRRDRVVPEDVMRRMAAKLKPPAFTEGFTKITVVRVKKKDDAEAQA